MNPLYLRGHDRVGCYPCIFSKKEEIALIADQAPWRIDEIRNLETQSTASRVERNAAKPGRYAYTQATFFQTRSKGIMDIDAIASWARTPHGNAKLNLLREPPSGGCLRWGLCEPPSSEAPKEENP